MAIFAVPIMIKFVAITCGVIATKVVYDAYQENKIDEERNYSNKIKAKKTNQTKKIVEQRKYKLIQDENKRRIKENNYIDKKIKEYRF